MRTKARYSGQLSRYSVSTFLVTSLVRASGERMSFEPSDRIPERATWRLLRSHLQLSSLFIFGQSRWTQDHESCARFNPIIGHQCTVKQEDSFVPEPCPTLIEQRMSLGTG